MKKIILYTCMVLVAGCGRITVSQKDMVPVRIMEVTPGDLKEELFYVGDIQAQDQAEVYPKVTGKLTENKVKEGDNVEKGDTIAMIDRDEIGFEFEPAPVASPITGIVGRMYMDRGDQVSPQTEIAIIVNIDNVKVKIDVTEIDLPKLKEEQIVILKVDAYPDREFKGEVYKISPVLDLWSRTAPVEILVPNPDSLLKPGMFARAWIVVKERLQVPYILKDAVIKREDGYYVFSVKDNKAHISKVALGLEQDMNVEVTDGLKPGDNVVVMGQTGLEEGTQVKVVE